MSRRKLADTFANYHLWDSEALRLARRDEAAAAIHGETFDPCACAVPIFHIVSCVIPCFPHGSRSIHGVVRPDEGNLGFHHTLVLKGAELDWHPNPGPAHDNFGGKL